MTTSQKLWLGFGTLIALLILVCLAVLLQMWRIDGDVQQMTTARERSGAATELEVNVVGYALAVRAFLDTKDPKLRQEALEEGNDVERHLAEYGKHATSPRHQQLATEFSILWQQLRQHGQKLMATHYAPDRADSLRLVALRTAAEKLLDGEMQFEAVQNYDARLATTQRHMRTVVISILVLLFAGAVIGALTGLKVNRAVAHNERTIAEQMQAARLSAAIVESTDDAVISKSLDGVIQSWNNGAELLFGYTAQQAVGRHISLLIPADRADEEDRIIARLRNGERIERFDTVRLRSDGQPIHVSLTISPVRDSVGRVVGASKIARDITEQKRLEDELRRYAAELSDADRRKNEFLALLSHELRNPLAPIRNALQIMRLKHSADVTTTAAVEMMQRQLNQLIHLVDDLLDVSRISRGKIELRRERIELASVIHHAVDAARTPMQTKHQAFSVRMPQQPIFVDADAARLGQVIENLLNNACKFTQEHGRIELALEPNATHVLIRVRDNGVGIAAQHLTRVFDMFAQVDTSLERSAGGLGIGLTLVKTLVELHGGTVQAHSAGVGQGSEFVVRLPIASEDGTPQATTLVSQSPSIIQNCRILIVDDNADSAASLASLLQPANQTCVAHDGIAALELAQRVRPDIILLDIGMPKMNGYEVCRQLRKQAWGKQTIVIAITGWSQEQDRQKSKDAGFDGHLVKPVEYEALVRTLRLARSRPAS